MIKRVKNSELFSDINPLLLSLFTENLYPWNVLTQFKTKITELLASPPQGFTFYNSEVLVGENVKIHPSAVIQGPAVICKNTEIRTGAFLRGNVFCGENCVIGNSSELKNCILLDRVQIPHYNYVGDSILGFRAHMGAGSICSNLKSDGKDVFVRGEETYETGLRKFGAILGDDCEIGCGCVLNPGTIVGKKTSVYPLTSLRGVYPADCIVKSQAEVVKRK